MNARQWSRALFVLLGTGVLSASILYAYVIFFVFDDPFDNRPFDNTVWAAFHESIDPDNPRGEMYEDLTDNVLRTGMDRTAIINLLGPPDHKEEAHLISYNLGMWSGFRIDYDTLDLELDGKGKLVRVRRIQH